VLRRTGFEVAWRRVQEEPALLQALAAELPDVILCDHRMHKLDGQRALRIAQERAKGVPFIFVSGGMGEESALQALREGADDYVLKDRIGRLGEAVRQALERSRLRRDKALAEAAQRESEERFRQIAENIREVFWLTDPEKKEVLYISPAYREIWGRDAEALSMSPQDWVRAIHPEDRARVVEAAQTKQKTGEYAEEYRITRGDGAIRWIRDRAFPVLDSEGNVYRIAGVAEDITERKGAEDRIKRLNRVYAVLSGINSLIVRVRDRDELFREACRIAVEAGRLKCAWIGVGEEGSGEVRRVEHYGAQLGALATMPRSRNAGSPGGSGLVGAAMRSGTAQIVNDVATDPRMIYRREVLAEGFRSTAVLPLILGGQAMGVLTLMSEEPGVFDDEETRLWQELAGDISFALDHLAKAERLDYLAYYDALTGLPNRTFLRERLAQHVEAAQRDRRRFAFLKFDIARFHSINNAFGRNAGDLLLKQLAQRLSHGPSEPHGIGRVGGDMFAAVIPNIGSDSELARQIEAGERRCFGEPFKLGDAEVTVFSKAGIAIYPTDGKDADTLLAHAQAALRRAKESTQPYLFYAEEMTTRVAERLALEGKLRDALAKEQFVLHYQPKYRIEDREMVGVEALIRWQSPEHGLVPPARFISVLEETGLIVPVGAWALRRAALDQDIWTNLGLEAPRVAVNVSPAQLRDPNFVDLVSRTAPHSAIDLEITESVIMENIEGTIEKLRAFASSGINIAIDDFGTGYSSLAYLAKLPVQAVKIDRMFIKAMLEGPDTATLVSTIISLAHWLRLKVIAEGVETEEQAKLLRLMRCDEVQGYLLAEPMTQAALTDLLFARAERQ